MTKDKGGRPKLYDNPEKLQEDIDSYFDSVSVDVDGVKRLLRPTMSGLALALNMSRSSLVNYAKKDKFFVTVKAARQKVESALETALYDGTVAGVIFNLKNNFDWRDKQEFENTHKVEVVEIVTSFENKDKTTE